MIKANVIADTVYNGKRITSMELEMPRFILAQFNTHRMFSRNTASSRAIPTKKMIENILNDSVTPIHWGENQPGMVAGKEINQIEMAQSIWFKARDNAIVSTNQLLDLGVHKQVVNRLLEPFMYCKTIVTATEWDNFFNLRLAEDAQPEIQQLAKCMKEAMEKSVPKESMYHLPYISEEEFNNIFTEEGNSNNKYDLFCNQAIIKLARISSARCARVSYLNHDNSNPDVKKDLELAFKLSTHKHLSPFEHQAVANLEVHFRVIDCSYDEEEDSFDRVPAVATISPEDVKFNNFIGWRSYRHWWENE